jgi:hypothetical protein
MEQPQLFVSTPLPRESAVCVVACLLRSVPVQGLIEKD